ncbi:mitochondrial ribosomal protein subunit L20-domain-containing protein [Phlyctochytrium arcticum]|nr:mitochondrial ribosomal protein subunit L20-domain-containing protein [Phlyctochytrium arcticum]
MTTRVQHHRKQLIAVLADGSKLSTLLNRVPAAAPLPEPILPPRLRPQISRPRLTPENIQTIRSLRQQDPDRWTLSALSKEFNANPAFISRIAPCPKERVAAIQQQENDQFDRMPWTRKKRWIEKVRREALW